MQKNVSKIVQKTTKGKPKTTNAVDAELAEHLKQAEYHLIAAVKLFSGHRPPSRVGTYLQRLERAQEAITGLYREELVRIRGPVRKKG
jgi:hypothetical protein